MGAFSGKMVARGEFHEPFFYGQAYLLPFEATSLLLLVAIVGAVVVAKGRI